MSGSIPPEDRAGLYVLGALNAEEMRAVRLAAGRDDVLAAEITEWEQRLAPLTALIDPVEPPATLWAQLEGRLLRITGSPEPIGEVYQPPQQRQKPRRRGTNARGLAIWRGTAIAAMALAAGLAFMLVRRPAAPPPGRVAMLLPARPGEGGWLLQVRPNGEILAQTQGAVSRALDRDYELWVLPDGADRPLPVGLLPGAGASSVLKTTGVPATKFQFLVSLEPKGGSPTGLPTGQVMYGGVPAAQPPAK